MDFMSINSQYRIDEHLGAGNVEWSDGVKCFSPSTTFIGSCQQNQYTGKNLFSNASYVEPQQSTVIRKLTYSHVNFTARTTVQSSYVLSVANLSTAGIEFDAGTYYFSVHNLRQNCVSNISGIKLELVYLDEPTNIMTVNNGNSIVLTKAAKPYALRMTSVEFSIGDSFEFDVQFEKSASVTDFEPYCGGAYSPSPAYPQTIRFNDSTLSMCGKNLFNKGNYLNFDAWISANNLLIGYAGDSFSIALPCLPNKTYTISVQDIGEISIFRGGYIVESESVLNALNNEGELHKIFVHDCNRLAYAHEMTVNTGADATFLVLQVSKSVADDVVEHLQIELGTAATDYADFEKTSEVNLSALNLGSIMGETDIFNGETGELTKVTKRVKLKDLPFQYFSSPQIFAARIPDAAYTGSYVDTGAFLSDSYRQIRREFSALQNGQCTMARGYLVDREYALILKDTRFNTAMTLKAAMGDAEFVYHVNPSTQIADRQRIILPYGDGCLVSHRADAEAEISVVKHS